MAEASIANKFIKWCRNPQIWGFGLSIFIMAVVSLAFFHPDAIDGNTLWQPDTQQGMANGHEGQVFNQQTGEKALWTGSLFSGMPTFQISPSYPSDSLFSWLNNIFSLGLPAPANLLFAMMLGFLILMYAMGFKWYYALTGAIAWGFSSYFIIIIGAGHIWKFVALTYIPPTIAGLILCYRRHYLAGAAMTAIFAMLQLKANHPQMSYYFAFVMTAIAVAYLVEAVRTKTVRRWLTASAVIIAAGMLAIGANLPSLYHTYEYAKYTKRAQSELTPVADAGDAQASAERPTGGLPKSDIVGWSYGKAETFSLLVPDIKGGATARPEQGGMTHMTLDKLDDAKAYADTPSATMLPYLTQYFNDSEGTNGPVYVGAIICALFLLGCIIVRGPMKWALVIMTVLSILLAWGRNFEPLTDFMIYHFPLYSKFRAVESILVIAEFCMPLLAIMALHQLLVTDDALSRYRRPLMISFCITAAVALAAALAPSLFGAAITDVDRATSSQLQQQALQLAQQYGLSQQEASAYVYQFSLTNPDNASVIESLRYGMVKADGLRSLLFIALAASILMFALKSSVKKPVVVAAIAVLVLVDLYTVDKRYLSHDSFRPAAQVVAAEPFTPDQIDNTILADTATHYRVMDIPGFWQADRSYFHKTIGGYHAAKLNRYEDLIRRRMAYVTQLGYDPTLRLDSVVALYPAEQHETIRCLQADYRILDMLNARYIITGNPEAPVMQNTHALGNAWLVDTVRYVDGADAEMDALASLQPATQAVADRSFEPILAAGTAALAPGDTIRLTSYTPNTLTYHATVANGAVGVFSEVWFPWGWQASIDGTPVPLARVDYLLRALYIPAGNHTVSMTFDPRSLHTTGTIAYICIALIYLLALAAAFITLRSRNDKPQSKQ